MKSLRTITRDALDSFVPMTMNSIHDVQFNIKRKIILSIVCFAFIGMMPLYAQQASAVLHHQGTVTVYSPANFKTVFTDATDGDTIYISEGIVSEGIGCGNQVTIIGAGQNTVISGDLAIGGGSKIANMNITGKLSDPGYAMFGETQVSQCRISLSSYSYSIDVEKFTFDRCYIENFDLRDNVSVLNVIGCKIGRLFGSSTADKATFRNCLFKQIDNEAGSYPCIATYTDCVIGGFSAVNFYNETTYINCLFYADAGLQEKITNSTTQNCWYNTDFTVDDDINCSLTDAQLVAAGYVGTDDTAVGCGGGVAPYTLTPAVPRITDHTISVDSKTRKLNVSLTIGN